jgi:hypothetical protein
MVLAAMQQCPFELFMWDLAQQVGITSGDYSSF